MLLLGTAANRNHLPNKTPVTLFRMTPGMSAYGIPAANVLELARHVVLARIPQADGDQQKAIGEFETAAEIEDSLPYMEPAYWYYPVNSR